MKLTIEKITKDESVRMLKADEVFSLLWDIDQELRSTVKYGREETKDELADRIRALIWETNLLDLYT